MAFLSKIVVLVSFFTAIYAAPLWVPRAKVSAASSCASWGVIDSSPYELQSNLWGASGASGSQCTNLTSSEGNTVAWSTTWEWSASGYGVKSFSNIQLNSGIGKQLSAISSMLSTWKWSQSSSHDVMADVAYDLFTSSSPTGDNEHEVMIWLANFNTGPISYTYDSAGAVALVTDIKIANHTWNLYEGTNGHNMVWSFLLAGNTTVTHFKGDVNLFFNYLTSQGYVPSSQYLKTAQGGTEATRGSANFTTSAYSLRIN
jgi:xyloglucan-specific endo-beta-1,4-glucanase